MQTAKKEAMKTNNNSRTAQGCQQRQGMTSKSALAALCLLAAVSLAKAAPDRAATLDPALVAAGTNAPAMPTNSVAAPNTNGILGRIQADLGNVKGEILAAVKQASDALRANPANQATVVTNLAAQLRSLATNDLGPNGQFLSGLDELLKRMRAQYQKGLKHASSTKDPAASIYNKGLPELEKEIQALEGKRTSISVVRKQLIDEANELEAKAGAIGWLDSVQQTEAASQAMQKVIADLIGFVGRVRASLDQFAQAPLNID